MRDFQMPGRSTAHGVNGMAATSHPLATLAAIDMLRAGGNAIDAAIAAAAVQAVAEPHSTGIGGDCFVLYVPRGGAEIIALNGSGRAPQAAVADWFLERGIDRIGPQSPHAVTVPGAVDAWARLLADHGTKSMAEVLRPAIRHAADGFAVHPRSARDWAGQTAKLGADPTAARIFLPRGRAPRAGEIHRQPELAATLERIAAQGRDGFYVGPVAEDIVSYLNGLGGLHTPDDFARHRSEYVTPIHASYRGLDVYECPPNGQGIGVLIMLSILAGFDLAGLDPMGAPRLHLQAEATRLAYAIMDRELGDPAQIDVPVEKILSPDNIDGLRARIRMDGAIPDLPGSTYTRTDTVYLCVVDRDRNAVSFINSIYYAFGSGLVGPASGVVLQNRGAGFVIEPGHPNCIAPGKRPRHTIIPGMVMKNGRAVMPFGVMGGEYQPVGQAQVLANIADFGMDPQSAIDMPRGMHHAGIYELERGIDGGVARQLQGLGHEVSWADEPMGGGQAIWIDWQNGTLIGGSDPRKDGFALGY